MRAFWTTILGLVIAVGFAPRGQAELINGIQAVVHDSVVTRDEVRSLNEQTAGVVRRQYGDQPDVFQKKMEAMERDNLEMLVDRQLILREFKTAGYSLPESVLEQLVQEDIRSRYPDRATLIKTLEMEGITLDKYRQRVRDDFIVRALRAKNVSQEIVLSPHKVATYYQQHQDEPLFKVADEVKLRMIVLSKTSAEDEHALRTAQNILTNLNAGKSFEEQAKAYTQAPQRDGAMGWKERGMLRKELADVAFALKPGEHSGVIDTPEACYLVLVEDAHPAHTRPLNEVRDQIERSLLLDEQRKLEEQWVTRLKKKTFVQYH
jgi:peptidyl-prolyl cis-trans isomerase SurA